MTEEPETAVLPDPIEWITNNFFLYDTGELITLFDCQIRPLRLAFSKDNDGNYKYTTILWSWPKKSAKSSLVAAIVDYIAWNKKRATITLTGNDQRQADSRVGRYLRENLKLGDRKGDVKITPSGYTIEYLKSGSLVEMVPIDPEGEAGGNQDLIVFSELWGWKSKAHQKMWTELTISPNKFGKAQRWIDTYAGFTGESPVLEQLYETAVTNGKRVWDDLEVYVNNQARTLAVWATRPYFPWQVPAYYKEQAGTLLDNEFRRIHKNEWVSSKDVFVPAEWWAACQDHVPRRDGEYWVVAMDAAVSGDSFGVVAVSLHPLLKENVVVRYARAWYPPKGGKLDFQGTEENPGPEREVIRLCKQYNVAQVAYDPYQLEDMANRLRKKGIAWFFPFSQGAMRLKADSDLRQMIRDRRIHHSGEPRLKEHVENSGAEINKDDNKIRIVKLSQEKKVDLCVALSMSADRVLYLNL